VPVTDLNRFQAPAQHTNRQLTVFPNDRRTTYQSRVKPVYPCSYFTYIYVHGDQVKIRAMKPMIQACFLLRCESCDRELGKTLDLHLKRSTFCSFFTLILRRLIRAKFCLIWLKNKVKSVESGHNVHRLCHFVLSCGPVVAALAVFARCWHWSDVLRNHGPWC
jgi:hypothetical protein